MNLASLSTQQVELLLSIALFTPITGGRWGLPILLWGPPGIGKSALILRIAALYDLPVKLLSPGRSGEGAFGVIPVPSQRNGQLVIEYPPPAWVNLFRDQRGIVFCDELNSAAEDVIQAAMLGLVWDREIAGTTLPPGVRVLAAANPTDVAAGGRELAFPVLNRFGHVTLGPPSVEDHVAYMRQPEVARGELPPPQYDAAKAESAVLANWPQAWSQAVALETEFHLSRGGADKNIDYQPGMLAVPTDRTWELATRAYAGYLAFARHDPTVLITLLSAFIGNEAAMNWLTFIRDHDLPLPVDILDGRVELTHDPKRPARTASVLTSCILFLSQSFATIKGTDKTSPDWKTFMARCKRFVTVLDNLLKAGVPHEFVKSALLTLQGHQDFAKLLATDPKLAAAIAPVAAALGAASVVATTD